MTLYDPNTCMIMHEGSQGEITRTKKEQIALHPRPVALQCGTEAVEEPKAAD